MIETVFFDGDQTLWDFDAVMRGAMTATLDELRLLRPGPATAALDVDDLVADRQAVAASYSAGAVSMERLRLLGLERTLSRVGLDDDGLAQHLCAFFLERRFARVELYPDTVPALRALRQTHRLGLLSNGNGCPARSGLGDLFDVVVLAQDHGVAKPDRRLYDAAARLAGKDGAALAMVGDSLVNDVRGAQEAGWTGIWLNRDPDAVPGEVRPDATVTSLTELPSLLTMERCGDRG